MPNLPNPSVFPAAPNNPNDGYQVSQYEDGAQILNSYLFEPGTCVLPLAEDPPTDPQELALWSPVVVLRLHAPYRIRKVTYNNYKSNTPPVIPSPKDVGAFIFLGGTIVVTAPMNSSYFQFDWKVISDYTFVENCVSRPEDGLVLGIPPWQWQSSSLIAGSLNQGTPQIGAIAHAGSEPLVAFTMGNQVEFNNQNGYFYNMPSYLPGVFFNDYIINGGVPVVPPPPPLPPFTLLPD